MEATIFNGKNALGATDNGEGVIENGELRIKVDFIDDCGADVQVYNAVFNQGLNMPAILLGALNSLGVKIKVLETEADGKLTKRFKLFKDKNEKKFTAKKATERKDFLEKKVTEVSSLNIYDREFLNRISIYMEENMSDDTYWVDDLSYDMNTSRSTFFRKLKKLTGYAPKDYMRNMRLTRAAELLENGQLRIAEVSYQVGFSDPNYFSKCFRRFYGTSPSDYSVLSSAS
ncbi:AraC family transcriptional regulator [Zobellia roscoffensis]|uniref:helix-turn-helix domain-containing protein n=1 Tax=Zobellia roscoffensis TaxID=2779508 RepID=UPI00188BBE02|nr:AraC family transcriptional regulator [Zobellia roscoffensis]